MNLTLSRLPSIRPWVAAKHMRCLALGLWLASTLASAATVEVTVQNFSFSPSVINIQAGDTVRWRGVSGVHNVVADDNSFRSGSPVTNLSFEHTFNSAGNFRYYCEPHGGPGGAGMSGVVNVQGSTPPAGPTLTRSSSGSWFNASTNGQGFLVEVYPEQNIFTFAWFTWLDDNDTDPQDYDWMTGNGGFQGNVATLEVFRSRNGRFNDPNSPVATTAAGTATFTLNTCNSATFTYNLTDPVRSGTIQLTRILPSGPECVNPPANE